LQSDPLFARQQRGHLRQPGWCELVQKFNQSLATGFLAQATKRFQHRHIGFARTVLFDTLAAPNGHRAFLRD